MTTSSPSVSSLTPTVSPVATVPPIIENESLVLPYIAFSFLVLGMVIALCVVLEGLYQEKRRSFMQNRRERTKERAAEPPKRGSHWYNVNLS